ncbi:response regulator [Nocardia mexicana]|uniref:LuxR family two component transcriptional regulator n=1 Tax=Nocardia mexicana TaxID=279262 RepID=A0A370GTJ8_9NOCA|nr:response regulator transcription factor [Nocardia mexicana]RDI45243.1 LuxR family two component transcriptional regulator [Nocardia mexicana]
MLPDTTATRIVVADDHTLLRDTLCETLQIEDDFTICGVAGDGEEVLAVASRVKPDIVLLDLDMPQHNPFRSVATMRALTPSPKIIIVTMHDRADIVRKLLDAGAVGYLSKNVSRQHLVTTIRSVRDGQSVIVVVSGGLSAGNDAGHTVVLSAREVEVLALAAEALSNRQIAKKLAITEGTVKRHLHNCFEKLGADSRMAAVRKAREAALLEPEKPYFTSA